MSRIAAVILLGLGSILPAAAGEEPTGSLEAARQQGRARSRFLHAAPPSEQQAADPSILAVPSFKQAVEPILLRSCVACHGPERSEGGLRIDQLNPDLLAGPDVELWRKVANVLSKSEMPPADEPEFAVADADRSRVVDWLGRELTRASQIRRDRRERSSFRRLTTDEYQHALQDLLGLPAGLTEKLTAKLPPETLSEQGFKNSSELLATSALHLEAYRDIGLKAIRSAVVIGDRPPTVTFVVSMPEEMERAEKAAEGKPKPAAPPPHSHLVNRETGGFAEFVGSKRTPLAAGVAAEAPPPTPVAMCMPPGQSLPLNVDRHLPDDGVMRIRVRVARSVVDPKESAGLQLQISAHTSNNASFSQIIGDREIPVTATVESPEFVEFRVELGEILRNPFRNSQEPFPRRDENLTIRNKSRSPVFIDYVELIAPFHEQWPPRTHANLFVEAEDKWDEAVYGRKVLGRFLRRAWRRPVEAAELDQWMGLFATYRPECATFEEAMAEVLATALASPDFLHIVPAAAAAEGKGAPHIDDFAFATRLAIFLWSSLPDDELLGLAERHTLRDPHVLAGQIDRMLADPRSGRFVRAFVEQWLGLARMESVTHVKDATLRAAMLEEPVAFFDEVLRNNRSIMDLIHSDYAVVNDRLAGHYRIPDVRGPQFRRVPISPAVNRGGVLTSAVVLAMNADDKHSNPLKRGVWLLKRILDDPPPPPPPDVPEVDLTDPEILKMTLKERIANHRNKAACMSCHSRIDPWGIALENYDPLGAFRTAIDGKPVDATAELYNRQKLAGIEGLKRHLLADRQDQFATALTTKLAGYALGRPLAFADRADLEAITAESRRGNDGLRDLVKLLIVSDLFSRQ